MGMSADFEKAFNQLRQMGEEASMIALLPTKIGARVQWHNGVIWTRVGGDAWEPERGPKTDIGGRAYTSRHIAMSQGWMELKDPTPSELGSFFDYSKQGSLYDYRSSETVDANDYPFVALIWAAMRRADTGNQIVLKKAYPELWKELEERYNAPGGRIGKEKEQEFN